MATNRKSSPSSAPAPAGDASEYEDGDIPDISHAAPPPPAVPAEDGDITLEDHEDRRQQRPRLPDQRREKQSFEMSASLTPVREPTPPDSWEATEPVKSSLKTGTTPEEIAAFDPLAVEVPPPPSAGTAPRPGSATRSATEILSTPGLDDLEEFIARTATEGPSRDKVEKVRRPFTLVEKICSAAGLAILIGAAVWLITSITGEADGKIPVSTPWPDLPMEGSLITISEAASSWRMRAETDRVGQMEVILPVPGQQMPEIIPQVSFTIDAGKSSSGFLRFIFKDTEGKPRGDTRVVQIENGKLKDLGKGEIIKGGTEGTIYGSYGLLNTAAYRSYEGNDKPRWSVEIAESATYDADDKDWKILGTFNVRNELPE